MATTPGTSYDVVISGSGFGGSISASRLALAGLKVLVQRCFRCGRAIR
jgi:choline dehydrogenase-like flavoprotein